MAEVTTKFKFLLFILVISFIINLGIGITSMVNTNSSTLTPSTITSENKNQSQDYGLLLGVISIPAFVIPYISIVSLSTLGMPTEIFLFISVFLGILETIKLFLYVATLWNFLPFTNT